jgi:hypothetical protein
MSLGGWPTDGTDPMSQAVTRLTNQYRTLFVVAAGNSGPGGQTVENPGVATDALTVGASTPRMSWPTSPAGAPATATTR